MEIYLNKIKYNNKNYLSLKFKYNTKILNTVKNIPGRKWDNKNKLWYISLREDRKQIKELKQRFNNIADLIINNREVEDKEYIPDNTEIKKIYLENLRLRRYSKSTVKAYISNFRRFLDYFSDKNIANITTEEIKQYLLYLIENKKHSHSAQNQAINAIKFYFEKVLKKKRIFYYIDRPRKEYKLPEVLSEKEVAQLLNTINNLKHYCIISLIYSVGLRISEVVNLKVSDIDSNRKQILIHLSKGNKDRYIILSDKILNILRKYYKKYNPENYLFKGAKGGEYSKRSIQNIFKKALIKARINKHATVHTFRHSFATLLLEHGTDIRYVQHLVGHKNIKTTEKYTHITKNAINRIKSPFDGLEINER